MLNVQSKQLVNSYCSSFIRRNNRSSQHHDRCAACFIEGILAKPTRAGYELRSSFRGGGGGAAPPAAAAAATTVLRLRRVAFAAGAAADGP